MYQVHNRNGHQRRELTGRKHYLRKTDQSIKTIKELGIFEEVQKVAIENVKTVAAEFYKYITNLDTNLSFNCGIQKSISLAKISIIHF